MFGERLITMENEDLKVDFADNISYFSLYSSITKKRFGGRYE